MIPTLPTDQAHNATDLDHPRYFIDDAFDAGTDHDWWLDLGRVDLPPVPGM